MNAYSLYAGYHSNFYFEAHFLMDNYGLQGWEQAKAKQSKD